MKKIVSFALILTVAMAFTAIAGDEHKGHGHAEAKWFDMENCEFCQHLTKDEGLLDNMTWETKDVKNGVVTISTVNPEYKDSYDKAHAAMMALGQEIDSGKRNPMEMTMCGHCQHYGQLMFAGANFEYIDGEAADITLITSDDEDVLKQIKTYGERNRTEMKKMAAEMEKK